MARPIRLVLLLMICSMLPGVAFGGGDASRRPCIANPASATYVCSAAGLVRIARILVAPMPALTGVPHKAASSASAKPSPTPVAVVRAHTPTTFLMVDAFQYSPAISGVASTTDAIRPSFTRVCLIAATRRTFAGACDIPADITFDPLLRSSTIKGSWDTRSRRTGVVSFDLTITGDSSTSNPDLFQRAQSRCGSNAAYGEINPLTREGAPSGFVRFSKSKQSINTSVGSAVMQQYSYLSGGTISANGCPARDPSAMGKFCEYNDLLVGGSCSANGSSRSGSVSIVTRTARIWVSGGQTQDPQTAVTDQQPAAPDQKWVCVELDRSFEGFGTCEMSTNIEVSFDPLLRSGTIRGTIPGENGEFDPFPTPFGSIGLDLEFTPKGSARVGVAPMASEGASCGFVDSTASTPVLSSPASATGHVSFDRSFGKFQSPSGSGFNATMESSVSEEGGIFADCSVPPTP